MPTYSPQPSFSRAPDPDGILLVDKPSGMTSHDVVNAVRKMFKIEKAGHGGTLVLANGAAGGLLVTVRLPKGASAAA